MEMMVKKFQQKYKKVRDVMGRWDELQSQLLSQFGNASSIIERLQVLREAKNYGGLRHVPGIKEVLLGEQMATLEVIFLSMKETSYLLKSSIISSFTWNCSASDIVALRQLLVDEPNIPRNEVKSIFDTMFVEEIG